jgi:hypothetical protein
MIYDLSDPAYVLFHAFCARLRRSLLSFQPLKF